MKSALFLWFLTATLAAQTASVEGTVVNKSTGEPVIGAHIRLIDSSKIQEQTFDAVYGAISGRAGHYSITGMKPGGYFVTVQQPGFIDPFRSGSVPPLLALKAGEHLADHKLEIILAAHLSGRVVDEDGDPASCQIQVRTATAREDYSGNGSTDDRGEFRVAVAPGRYYLQAQPNQQFGGPMEIRNGAPVTSYKTTYYPNSASRDGASVIEVSAGQEVTALDIRLTREAISGGRLLTISGAVTGIPEHTSVMVYLMSGASANAMTSGRSISINADGSFTVSGLEPKYYQLNAMVLSGKRMQSQEVDLHLTADQPNVQLTLAPAEELSGTLDVTGGTLPTGKKPSIYFDSNQPFGNSGTPAEPAADGNFQLAGMFPGKYRMRVESLPDGAYVKSVLLDGAPADPHALDLSRGIRNARLKIIVALNGGQLSGKVLGQDGQPVASPMVMLMVWKDPKSDDPDTQQIKNNEYKVNALPPGKIRILAVDRLDLTNLRDLDQAELTKLLKAAAEEIETKEGEHLVKDIKVFDKEKLNAGAKQ